MAFKYKQAGSVRSDHKLQLAVLAAIAIGSVILWQDRLGSLLLFPFTLLATWFHEMGHGLAALLTGSTFDHLVIFSDGSGYAQIAQPSGTYRLTDALISAGGPLGPALAGALLIMASRSRESTRVALAILGGTLLLSTAIWVRSLTGWLTLPALGLGIFAVALKGRPGLQQFVAQLLGVQACISVWKQIDYLFSAEARVGGQLHRSDTGAIADALLLPYWFWGAALSVLTMGLLWTSFKVAFQRRPSQLWP